MRVAGEGQRPRVGTVGQDQPREDDLIIENWRERQSQRTKHIRERALCEQYRGIDANPKTLDLILATLDDSSRKRAEELKSDITNSPPQEQAYRQVTLMEFLSKKVIRPQEERVPAYGSAIAALGGCRKNQN